MAGEQVWKIRFTTASLIRTELARLAAGHWLPFYRIDPATSQTAAIEQYAPGVKLWFLVGMKRTGNRFG